jgi:hypothetical protein
LAGQEAGITNITPDFELRLRGRYVPNYGKEEVSEEKKKNSKNKLAFKMICKLKFQSI